MKCIDAGITPDTRIDEFSLVAVDRGDRSRHTSGLKLSVRFVAPHLTTLVSHSETQKLQSAPIKVPMIFTGNVVAR